MHSPQKLRLRWLVFFLFFFCLFVFLQKRLRLKRGLFSKESNLWPELLLMRGIVYTGKVLALLNLSEKEYNLKEKYFAPKHILSFESGESFDRVASLEKCSFPFMWPCAYQNKITISFYYLFFFYLKHELRLRRPYCACPQSGLNMYLSNMNGSNFFFSINLFACVFFFFFFFCFVLFCFFLQVDKHRSYIHKQEATASEIAHLRTSHKEHFCEIILKSGQ